MKCGDQVRHDWGGSHASWYGVVKALRGPRYVVVDYGFHGTHITAVADLTVTDTITLQDP